MSVNYLNKVFLTIVFLLTSVIAIGQNQPEDIVSRFFKDFQKDGSSVALDNLYEKNKWIVRAKDAVVQLKTQMAELNEDYVGKYYGYELIVEKKLSDSYVLMSYMVKFDRQPLRFTFQFYKPNTEWITYSFKFDGNIDDEIEEAAKLYYLELKN